MTNKISETEEYFIQLENLEKQYGPDIALLYQLGSFYVILEYDPDNKYYTHEIKKREERGNKIGRASELKDILNMDLGIYGKDELYSRKHPERIGFPVYAYEDHKDKILDAGFTIIRMNQFESPGKKNFERRIVEVISPTLDINNITKNPGSNNILIVYINCYSETSRMEDYLLSSGVSTIDISTGKCVLAEFHSNVENPTISIQDTYRFIRSHNPKEILLVLNKISSTKKDNFIDYLYKILELRSYNKITIYDKEIDVEYTKLNYQISFFNKLYKSTSNKILSQLGIESMPKAIISFIILCEYCNKFDANIIKSLNKPTAEWINGSSHLILTFNAINQLNLLSDDKSKNINSLMKLIDCTLTAMGRRLLQNRITNPSTDEKKLNEYYDIIELMINKQGELNIIDNIRLNMDMPDIDRYHRKTILETIKPNELSVMIRSHQGIIKLFSTVKSLNEPLLDKLLLNDEIIEEFKSYMKYILSIVDIDLLGNSKIDGKSIIFKKPFIQKGIYQDLDKQIEELECSENRIEEILEILNEVVNGKNKKKIKLEYVTIEPKRGFARHSTKRTIIQTTKSRIDQIKKSNENKIKSLNLSFKTSNKNFIIESDEINKCLNIIDKYTVEIGYKLYDVYIEIINKLSKYAFYDNVSSFVSTVDYVTNGAYIAIKYNYFKPIITNNSTGSYFIAKNMRHPFCEQIINQEFVPNDISLGKNNNGILLYGVNASGKTTIAKSIGLNLILAQIGYYTAGQIEYKPYNKIITRLSGMDDILKGYSSFEIEMLELRTILKESDNNTLVLGDELCRGTESGSAVGLTTSTLEELVKRNTSFIFSTHLHILPELDAIKLLIDNDDLVVAHLGAYYDEEKEIVIYDRKLNNGQGSKNYGIEVAKSLHIGGDFIKRAEEIRKLACNEENIILNSKKSRYNSKLYVDHCHFCGSRDKLETHHIKEQHTANKNGFINHIHKNNISNLVILCDQCHDKIHNENLNIKIDQTNDSSILNIN